MTGRRAASTAAAASCSSSPSERGIPGAGTVHHVAWAVLSSEIAEWQRHVTAAGAHATPVIDRFYFQSVYFREPGGDSL